MSDCGDLMEAIAVFTRRNGEYVLVHRCLGCGVERPNRIAADDNFDLVLGLPQIQCPAQRDTWDEPAAIA